jgi:hypothetical protein
LQELKEQFLHQKLKKLQQEEKNEEKKEYERNLMDRNHTQKVIFFPDLKLLV